MPSFLSTFSILAGGLFIYAVFRVSKLCYWEWTSPLRNLPGPPSKSLFWGNMKEIFAMDNSVPQENWIAQYGTTIRYYGFFNASRLYTTDLKAINHILMHTEAWEKPLRSRPFLAEVVGDGLLVVEGETHKRQRRIMNPAFGRAQVRDLTEIFLSKSLQLRDIWSAEISSAKASASRIDVLSWLGRATLDIIGLAGFNYTFNALNTSVEPSELNKAFTTMFESTQGQWFNVLQTMFPVFRLIPTARRRQTVQAQATMNRIGRELVRDSKVQLHAGKNSTGNRDLLSLLVRANTPVDGPDMRHKLTEQEVLDQVPTFLVAGHETTSSAVTWALYALTQAPDVQKKLRKELLTVSTDNPTMDELNNLVYLDHVVREVMRIHAPVPSTMREAVKDDVIPLSTPFLDRNGVWQESIVVKKGQTTLIPILTVNRSESIWGPDAKEFIPERWSDIPSGAGAIPGIWGNMLSFLGGTRACIGYQFSLVEMKALMFTLVRAFEFELAVPASDIGKKSSLVQRPIIISDPKAGNQMPLLVKPYLED